MSKKGNSTPNSNSNSTGQQQSQSKFSSLASSINIDKSSGVVGVSEGISYGLGLMIYFILLTVVTGIISVFGFVFVIGSGAVDNIVVSGLLALIGFIAYMGAFAVFFAGFAGLLYKIITDGVARALMSLS